MPPLAAGATSTIVNSRTGQRMRFAESSPDLLRIECWSPPSSLREPEHTHPKQDSSFELLHGALVFEVEGSPRTVAAPGTMTIPSGVRHRFWNAGEEEAHYMQEFCPALESRAFFELLFRLANEGQLDDKGMPRFLALPAVYDASADVIRPSSPPWPVLGVLAAVARPFAAVRRRIRRPNPLDVRA